MAAAANATTTRIGAHLGRREIILGFIGLLHESAMSPFASIGTFGQDVYSGVGTSCPGRVRRYVGRWRKPTPHSKAHPLSTD